MLSIVAVLVIGSLLFAATEETSRLKITATVTEGSGNNGIHILAGKATTILAGMTRSANGKCLYPASYRSQWIQRFPQSFTINGLAIDGYRISNPVIVDHATHAPLIPCLFSLAFTAIGA